MRVLTLIACCLAPVGAVSAEPFYVWLEAETLGGWTQVHKDECSGGTFVAGNVESSFAGDYVPLPGKTKFRA